MGGASKKRRHCASWTCLKAAASLQLGFVMDLARQCVPGCKGCEKHVPVLWRGLQMSSLANGNTELVTRSAPVEGDVSPRPSKWSGPVMHNQTLHYPHHSSLLPCPAALAARECWGRVVLGHWNLLQKAYHPLSHTAMMFGRCIYLAFIKDLSISSSRKRTLNTSLCLFPSLAWMQWSDPAKA